MVHMIGNAHLDPVWLWSKLEGFAEIISTMESAVRRIEEDDKFIFTCSSAAYYEFVEKHVPSLFKKIQKYVREKRWNIVGGYYIQPDNNIPCGEMFARQALFSQRYYLEKFQLTCKTGYCVDSFGHSGNLPQILLQSGMSNYVFMRPQKHENEAIPNLFYWKGVDGSEVLTYRLLQLGYNNFCSEKIFMEDVESNLDFAEKHNQDMMCLYGVGNHGGGPTRENIKKINELIGHGYDIGFGGVDSFFEKIRAENKALPQYAGDLQHHAIGCYSVGGYVKQAERLAEDALLRAEKYMLLANKLIGSKYDGGAIMAAYKNVMFNNFHDIICGCCIKDAMDLAVVIYNESISVADRIIQDSLIGIVKNIDTMIDGVTHFGKTDWQVWEEENLGLPLVIFNPHGFKLKTLVKLSRVFQCVVDENGKPVQIQYCKDRYLNGAEDKATLFEAEIPPLGYVTYWVYKNKKVDCSADTAPIAIDNILENQYLKVTFDKEKGGIISLYDKEKKVEMLKNTSFIPQYMDDDTDTWAHSKKERFDYSTLQNMMFEDMHIDENGSVLGSISFRHGIGKSSVTQVFSLAKDAKFLEVKVKINYAEKSSIVRLSADTVLTEGKLTYEIPFAQITKECNGSEEIAQRYAGIHNKNQAFFIISDYKSSFSAQGAKLSFTAIRNSIFGNHFGNVQKDTNYDYTDEGCTNFKYRICLSSQAHFLNYLAETIYPTDYLLDTYHSGSLERKYSFIKLNNENVALRAIKKSEDDSDKLIVRLNELSGLKNSVEMEVDGKTIMAKLNPYEIKSQCIDKKGNFKEVNFFELDSSK